MSEIQLKNGSKIESISNGENIRSRDTEVITFNIDGLLFDFPIDFIKNAKPFTIDKVADENQIRYGVSEIKYWENTYGESI